MTSRSVALMVATGMMKQLAYQGKEGEGNSAMARDKAREVGSLS
jgi:hypothetical protein